jgi:membrane protein
MSIKDETIALLSQTWKEFQEDNAGQLGAALAYYATFSIFPLLIILLAAFSFVLQYSPVAIDAQENILATVSTNFSPQLADTIEQILDVLKAQAGTATGVGLIVLLMGASAVFQQLDSSFNHIWSIPNKPSKAGFIQSTWYMIKNKLFSFGMVLSIAFLMFVSLALTGLSEALLGFLDTVPVIGGFFGYTVSLIITILLSTLIFSLLFKFLPDIKIKWADVWLGALFTALIWEIAKRILAIYIGRSSYASAYGAIGTVLVIMAWVFFSSQVLFLGAEFTKVYTNRYGSLRKVPEPEPEPEPEEIEQPSLVPVAAATPNGKHPTSTVAIATGAGLAAGAVGGILGILIAVLLTVKRLFSPSKPKNKAYNPKQR